MQKDLQSGTYRVSRSLSREEVRPHGASHTGHVLSGSGWLTVKGTQATEPEQEAMFSGKKDRMRPGAADSLNGTGSVTSSVTLETIMVVKVSEMTPV